MVGIDIQKTRLSITLWRLRMDRLNEKRRSVEKLYGPRSKFNWYVFTANDEKIRRSLLVLKFYPRRWHCGFRRLSIGVNYYYSRYSFSATRYLNMKFYIFLVDVWVPGGGCRVPVQVTVINYTYQRIKS